MVMDGSLTVTPPKSYINDFFRKAPNPMAVTDTKDGTYIDVNEAFATCMGVQQQELTGQTSVGIGYITADQRSVIFNEIKANGYAQNIEMEVRVKNNEARYVLFNSAPIKMEKDNLWFTVVTDISKRKLKIEAQQHNMLLKKN
jgi:PAS domain S-box-containing protein